MDSRIENSQFGSWYRLFRKFSPRAKVLECPEQFRQFLLADGIQLPGDESSDEWEYDVESAATTTNKSDSDNSCDKGELKPTVPAEFHQLVNESIQQLGGAVAPKLNWSSPRDAVWISPTNNMKCINANDVYMLLKSSDYCTFDLTKAYPSKGGPDTLQLVLREWFDINPSREFRCFVRDQKLVAITQRDLNYYEFLHQEKPELELLLVEFAAKLSEFPDSSFVFDAYIPKSLNRVWLIDINPWLDRTDTLLFDWDDLKTRAKMDFRLIGKEDATREFGSKPHTTNYVPHDFVDMDLKTAEDLVREMKLNNG